jgi:hypothetical protein
MICKENANDGKGWKDNETRVKASEYFGGKGQMGFPFHSIVGNLGPMGNMGGRPQEAMDKFGDDQFNQIFRSMFLPFFAFPEGNP